MAAVCFPTATVLSLSKPMVGIARHSRVPMHGAKLRVSLSTPARAIKFRQQSYETDHSPVPMHDAKIRVAYQGAPGACGEAAAVKAYPNCEAIPFDTIEDAVDAVSRCIVDRVVLAVENSTDGLIHRNCDLLLRYPLNIVCEVRYPVDYYLLAHPGVKKEDLALVISHSRALSQCEATLTNLGLNGVRVAMPSTAGAAEYIATNNLGDTAAIAPEGVAELYGLNILEDKIHDHFGNMTRFVILAREPAILWTDKPCKTSIVFADEEEASVLHDALSVFKDHKIKLKMIDPLPCRLRLIRLEDGSGKFFSRLFYADFEASMADVQKALKDLQERTPFVRVLGSYPKDMDKNSDGAPGKNHHHDVRIL